MRANRTQFTRLAVVTLLLGVASGAAQAKLNDAPLLATDTIAASPGFLAQQRADEAAERALSERRLEMIKDCEENNGTECAREVDTELRAEQLRGSGVIHLRPPR